MAHARWWSCRSCGRCRAGEGRGGSPETQGHPWRPMETQLAVTRTIPGLEQWLVVLSRWFSSKYIGLLSNIKIIKTIFVWHAWHTAYLHAPTVLYRLSCPMMTTEKESELATTCDNNLLLFLTRLLPLQYHQDPQSITECVWGALAWPSTSTSLWQDVAGATDIQEFPQNSGMAEDFKGM